MAERSYRYITIDIQDYGLQYKHKANQNYDKYRGSSLVLFKPTWGATFNIKLKFINWSGAICQEIDVHMYMWG
jgi:hypothetical protein